MLVRTNSASAHTTVLDWTAIFGYRSVLGRDAPITFGSRHSGSAVHVNGKTPTQLTTACEITPARTAFFEGVLYNRSDLEVAYADSMDDSGDAALVLRAYLRWGPEFLRHLKGIFALLVWDGTSDSFIAARDPLLFVEAGPALRQLGGVQTLADLHVVDRTATTKRFEEITSKAQYDQAGQRWDILSLETWARTHG